MLHGIREGVVAFDHHGRLSMVNDEARRLLELRHATLDEPLDGLLPEGRLRDLLSGEIEGQDQLVLTDAHLLVVNRMPVRVNGRDVGSVVTLRDRTELEALLRELDSVNGLTDALRAQQHIAAERGILLEVTEDSRLDHPGPDPQALLTIVGNLVDNAMDAVADSPPPRRIVVHLAYDHDARIITVGVSDSGPGVPPELADRVFQDGYTTKAPRAGVQRGLGLALVHRLVNRLGGQIEVTSGPSASFTVTLPVPVARVADSDAGVASELL